MIRDPALQVQGDAPLRQALQVVHGRLRRAAAAAGGPADRDEARPVGQGGKARRLVQDAGDTPGRGDDVSPLARGGTARVAGGPQQEQRARATGPAGQGSRGQREPVGQAGGGPRVGPRHVVLRAHPHQLLLAHGVAHRGRCAHRHPQPRPRHLRRHPAHHRQAQDLPGPVQHVDAARRGPGAPHGVGQGLAQRHRSVERIVAVSHCCSRTHPGAAPRRGRCKDARRTDPSHRTGPSRLPDTGPSGRTATLIRGRYAWSGPAGRAWVRTTPCRRAVSGCGDQRDPGRFPPTAS